MLRYVICLMCLAMPLRAEVPKVVTDIPPVHALAALVMQGVGAPQLVLGSGGSPHHHAMRPSEARMLAEADVVIWIGAGLTPWMQDPITNLSGGAEVLTLSSIKGAHVLAFREGAMFGPHEHDHGHDDGHEEGHEEGHDEHEEEHADEHADEGEVLDPHLWLDPDNAITFLNEISRVLSKLDAENASQYAQNAADAAAQIQIAAQEIEAQLAPVREIPFIVLHDGFHYFEDHFNVEAIGAVSAGDAQTPGAVRMKTLRTALQDSGVKCAFGEPGVGTRLLDTATEGMEVFSATLDPLGSTLEPGPALYTQMLRAIGAEMAGCLSR